jgi:ATP-dependent DNA helicase RecQ
MSLRVASLAGSSAYGAGAESDAEAFFALSSVIRGGPNLGVRGVPDLYVRARDGIEDLRANRPGVGPMDVAALVGTILRRRIAQGQQGASLVVPGDDSRWPTPEQWRACGVLSHPDHPGWRRVWAEQWNPIWLQASSPPAGPATAREPRREELEREGTRLKADPFFTAATGHTEYASEGQRLAVRTVAASHPDSTTLVVLPTGGGKSAVAHAAALLRGLRGTAITVVPTTALALDQARAVAATLAAAGHVVGHDQFAFHSGLDATVRQEILRRVREGSQIFLYTSPEALESSLRGALYAAARAGRISTFVVTDCHGRAR